MNLTHSLAAVVVAGVLPVAAFAHGGSYAGPSGTAPAGPQVPPGTADAPASQSSWETWWAANKEYYLRLGDEMRQDDGPVTRGGTSGDKAKESAADFREKRDAGVREALVPLFIEALGDDSFEVRTAAAIALGKTGSPEGSKPLREASSKDKHKDVRDSSVLALGLLGRQTDIPFLDARLGDSKDDVRHRSFAAFALGLIGGEDAAASLLMFADGKPDRPSTFEHEQTALIASTFVAMGLTCDRRVVPTLRGALTNPRFEDSVRAFVILSLGRMQDRESIGEIGRILVSAKNNDMRRSAAIALGKIARVEDKAAVDGLLSAAGSDSDDVVRQFCAIALGGYADAALNERLEKMFEDDTGVARPFVALALALGHDAGAAPMLRAALAKETDGSRKASYCLALALLEDEEAAPLIAKQLEDRGRIWLQGYAALSLGILRHAPSADMLFEKLTTEADPRLRANLAVALGLLHDQRAREHFVATLHRADGTIYERGGAAMAMGVLRMSEAFTDLADVYHDKKQPDLVRAFCVVALGLIADPSPSPKLARFAIDNNYSLSVDPLNEVLSIL